MSCAVRFHSFMLVHLHSAAHLTAAYFTTHIHWFHLIQSHSITYIEFDSLIHSMVFDVNERSRSERGGKK